MFDRKILPIKTFPQEDELLSSWLVRLAIAHGQKLHTFTRLIWNTKETWARDIDKSASTEQIQILAKRCGINFERAWQTTLHDYVGCIYETLRPLGVNPWITSVGVYHRKRVNFGQQFCPECLSEDSKPYFRRNWRLSFFTVCTTHKIPLSDCCFHCSFPVNFHRDELGNFHSFAPNRVTRCFNCLKDFRKNPTLEINVPEDEIEFYKNLHKTIEKGFWQLTPNRQIHSLSFFTGLRQILKILSMKDRRINNLQKELPHHYWYPISEYRETRDFPELRIYERRNLLLMANYLLKNWADEFVRLSKAHRIWSSVWLKHLEEKRNDIFRAAPFWLWETVNEFLTHRKYQPSDQEIEAVIRFLLSNNQPVTAFRICTLLCNYPQKLKKRLSPLPLFQANEKTSKLQNYLLREYP